MERLDEIRERLARIPDPVALLEGIFAYAPVGLQIYNSDGHCLLTNKAFRDLFGSEPPPEYNVLKDEIAQERGVLDLVHRAFRGETVQVPPFWYDPRELRQVRIEQGRRVAIESTFFPLFDRDGNVRHVAIVFKDVTNELLALEQLEGQRAHAEEAERRARFLADTSAALVRSIEYESTLGEVARLAIPLLAEFCIVDVIDDGGTIRRVAIAHAEAPKQALLEELQRKFPPGPVSPQPAARVIRSGEPEFLPEVTAVAIAEHTLNHEHRELMRRIGVRSHIAVPLKIHGRTLGALSLGRSEHAPRFTVADLELATELAHRVASAIDIARLVAESRAAARTAEEAVRARDEFISIASHELRTPLTPLQLQLDFLKKSLPKAGVQDERLTRRLDQAHRQTRRLATLVDSLLDVSRITMGRLSLELEDFDLSELVVDVVDRFQEEARRAGCTINVSADEPIIGRWDHLRLEQITSNLLSNAIKYGAGKPVDVSVDAMSGTARLTVRDHGIGIAPEDVARIFDRFERAVSTRHYGGLGLGLYIARQIAEAHGGSILVHSQPEVGSTFTVVLPLEPATQPRRPETELPEGRRP